MATTGVNEAAAMLRNFRFVDPTWDGTAFVPFWNSDLDISINPIDGAISRRQLKVLRAILDHATDLKQEFERALFDYYQADVDGSYASYDDQGPIPGSGPPKLTKPAQVWKLIDDPVVSIPSYFRTKSAIEFELSFNCEWDREHGLGVRCRNWRPVEFGGWDL